MKKPSDEANPSATIQLQLSDLELEELRADAPNSQALPPPLPPEVTPAAPAKKPAGSRPLVYGALFVLLLGAAIFGGVKFGLALRGAPPAASAPPPPSAAPADTAPSVVSIPTVEFTGGPADAQ